MTTEMRTPLYDVHKAAGAKLIDFGGFAMPVQYNSGVIKEHKAVRSAAGIFDVSHMGECVISGAESAAAVQRLVTGNVGKLESGAALYTVMCYPDGGSVDDLIVYKESDTRFYVIINASNRDKDLAWIREHVGSMAEVADESDDTALVAVQGPKAVGIVDGLSTESLASLPRFRHVRCDVAGVPCLVARTGYTGEDGFELACPSSGVVALWNAITSAGADAGLARPCGNGRAGRLDGRRLQPL